MNIFRGHSGRSATDPVLITPTARVSAAELADRVRDRATSLVSHRLDSSDRAEQGEYPRASTAHRFADSRASQQVMVVDDDDPVELLVWLLAAGKKGIVVVAADSAWPVETREAALRNVESAVRSVGPQAWLTVFTSGSTGVPRPVVRTEHSWTSSFPAFSSLTGIGPSDRVLVPGRLSGSLFLFGAVHALAVGTTVHLLPRWSPRQAAAAARDCTVVHAVPTMVASLAERLGPTSSRMRVAVCGGARLDRDTANAVRRHDITLVDYYGASELSFVALHQPGDPPGRMRPFPGVDIAVRDGVIWARSPYLASGLDLDDRGYATVGDRGTLHADDTLEVYGRGSATITTGGATVQAEAVEHALREVSGVADVAVVGRAHALLGEVVAAVVEPTSNDLSPTELRTATDRLPPTHRPRIWYVMDRLPRTSTGKIARARVGAALAEGSLAVRPLHGEASR